MTDASKRHRYSGAHAAITWDGKRCIHARECVRGLPAVFNVNAKPWIIPANSDADTLAFTIDRCPTGALKLERHDGAAEPIPATNSASITPNGPTYVRGDLALVGPDGAVALTDTRMALCRCGGSQNKPFCDGSHRKIGFEDAGALHAGDAPPASGTGSISIRMRADGPLVLTGQLTISGSNGRSTFTETAVLCRCGGSQNKPYCDGTHRRNGFTG